MLPPTRSPVDIMTGTSFLRSVSLHRLRKPGSSPHVEGPQPINSQQPGEQTTPEVPETQTVLLLHGPRQPYELTDNYPVPPLREDSEILVRTQAIGLNPYDWKAPDFNFGIPELPYISGRELAGEVALLKPGQSSRLKPGDRIIVISTDYRDLRKAAYQQYVVAFDYNTVRIPPTLSVEQGSTLGVAFVSAALALGVCMGLDFSSMLDGPNLYALVRQLPLDSIAADIREECLDNIQAHERALPGDWLAVWGASSTSANLTLQLARLAALRTVAIADHLKHGLRLSNHKTIRPDLLVDSHDPARAVDIIRANTQGQLRFGIDTRGRESAGWLMQALDSNPTDPLTRKDGKETVSGNTERDEQTTPPSPPSTPPIAISTTLSLSSTTNSSESTPRPAQPLSAHLVGLTGLPKQPPPKNVAFHTVPIKLFHEVPAVGTALVEWLERLLAEGLIVPPDIIDVQQGLGSVNRGLDRMRRGEISGGKLVVRVN